LRIVDDGRQCRESLAGESRTRERSETMPGRPIVGIALLFATIAVVAVATGQRLGNSAGGQAEGMAPATQPSDSIDEAKVQTLKEKAAAAHDALEKARDAALALMALS
jgi:hypothetical protein